MELGPRQVNRFWRSVDMTETCWLWTGWIDRYGYGGFKASGKFHLAHRIAYQFVKGPIPDGLTIDHLCRTRRCVNPAHLEPVTLQENIARGEHHERQQVTCKNGHPFDDENTYLYRGKRNCRTCRRETMRRLRQPVGE